MRLLHRIGDPIFGRLCKPWKLGWMRRLPIRPDALRPSWPARTWPEPNLDVPEELSTVPGIWRDPDAEEEAFRRQPVHDYFRLHPGVPQWAARKGWGFILPSLPRLTRSLGRLRAIQAAEVVAKPADIRPAELTDRIREEAARLGLSAVGFAPYDRKYTFAEYQDTHDEGSVIVCLFEQDHARTQRAPSGVAERHAMGTYCELVDRAGALATFVQGLGYRARPHSFEGETIVIHYAVQAGLGQLGLNGQLLTPAAGSRLRISVITTNAALEHGEPVDFGINGLCDECQICVRRCPVGAIPSKRSPHRGIVKAKVKTDRCLPTVIQAEGCGVCMKVCPVQRYGLEPVLSHFKETGRVLGKGTDELEGFGWPVNGRRYGPDSKPRIDSERFLRPPGLDIDPNRTKPPALADAAGPRPGEPLIG